MIEVEYCIFNPGGNLTALIAGKSPPIIPTTIAANALASSNFRLKKVLNII